MQVKVETKIAVLLEKMNYLFSSIQKNGTMSRIDRDLMTGYTKELYELLLSAEHPQQEIQAAPAYLNPLEHPAPVQEIPKPATSLKEDDEQIVMSKKTLSELIGMKSGNTPSLNEKLRRDVSDLSDKLQESPIRDLKVFIGLNRRFTFINFLFNGNADDYDLAINKLNASASYIEAINFLASSVANKNHWDENNPIVSEFYDLVRRRFLK